MKNQKVTGRALSIPSGLAIGGMVSMVTTILIAYIGAKLILSDVLPQDRIGYFSMAALITGTILGGVTATGKVKRKKTVVCLLSGGVYFCMLLATTALFFGGQYDGFGVTLLTVLIGCMCAALLTAREGKKHTQKRRKFNR